MEANTEKNRLQIFFDEIPDEDVRKELKSCGFKWARSRGAWQRQLTDNAIYAASRIKAIQPTDGTFFLCGLGEEDFVSLTPEQVKTYKDRFKKAEVFIAMNGDKPFTISVDATPKYLPEEPKHPRTPAR